MLAFLQSHGSAIAILISLASAVIAMRFVLKTEHEKAISSLDAKFVHTIEKLDKSEDRIAKLENDFLHLPDRNSVHRVEMSLERLEGRLAALGEQLKPVAKMADRMQDYLLDEARK